MKNVLSVILITVAFAFAAQAGDAPAPLIDWKPQWNETAQNRALIEKLAARLQKGETQNMLAYKRYSDGAVQAVFIDEYGARVTLYWNPGSGTLPGILSFWVRSNGTWGTTSLVTFTDEGLMGAVSWGMWAHGQSFYFDRERREGASHYGYWQVWYEHLLLSAEKIL